MRQNLTVSGRAEQWGISVCSFFGCGGIDLGFEEDFNVLTASVIQICMLL